VVDKIGAAAATVIQTGMVGSDTNNGPGFAEELAKQLDEKQQNSCCGGNKEDKEAVPSLIPATSS